ncbi:conserved hypothetical protein [Streptomyces himastatinicus ATCC 53653]|uniref:Uncharacterized protein n=1 Tax=Streptomyces himastatinicus ATCC 53653 TaxID=457427 RepID=D9WPR1_9ACTN|nr:hypothetical protein [Streptomyces himastatinicus]EFL23915.1 conserved hypothetical protein [Streptomyces himastatinicus ATCC 53653]
MGWHTLDPEGNVIPVEKFEAGYDRLLAPLAEAGTQLILIEPFLKERQEWHTDLDPKIQAVRKLARTYGAQLLTATAGPEHWSAERRPPDPGRSRRARGGVAAPGRLTRAVRLGRYGP